MRRVLIAAAVLVVIALGVPYGEIWFKCREAGSEACVWAKAFLPLSLGVYAALGAIAALVTFFALRWRARRGGVRQVPAGARLSGGRSGRRTRGRRRNRSGSGRAVLPSTRRAGRSPRVR